MSFLKIKKERNADTEVNIKPERARSRGHVRSHENEADSACNDDLKHAMLHIAFCHTNSNAKAEAERNDFPKISDLYAGSRSSSTTTTTVERDTVYQTLFNHWSKKLTQKSKKVDANEVLSGVEARGGVSCGISPAELTCRDGEHPELFMDFTSTGSTGQTFVDRTLLLSNVVKASKAEMRGSTLVWEENFMLDDSTRQRVLDLPRVPEPVLEIVRRLTRKLKSRTRSIINIPIPDMHQDDVCASPKRKKQKQKQSRARNGTAQEAHRILGANPPEMTSNRVAKEQVIHCVLGQELEIIGSTLISHLLDQIGERSFVSSGDVLNALSIRTKRDSILSPSTASFDISPQTQASIRSRLLRLQQYES